MNCINSAVLRKFSQAGLSRSDVVACLLVVMLLVTGFLFLRPRFQAKAKGDLCRVRLKNLGLAFADYANDSIGFPWEIGLADGGSSNYLEIAHAVSRHYAALSNYTLPWMFTCPDDERRRVQTWGGLSDSNLSYFVVVTTHWGAQAHVVAGDRYLTTNSTILQEFLHIDTNTQVRWASQFHNNSGNLLYTDGRVEFTSTGLVKQFFVNPNCAGNRLAIP